MSLSSRATIFHSLGIFLPFLLLVLLPMFSFLFIFVEETRWTSEEISLLVLDLNKNHEPTTIERYSFGLHRSKHSWVTRHRNKSSAERQRHLLSDQWSPNASAIAQPDSIPITKKGSIHERSSWSTSERHISPSDRIGTFLESRLRFASSFSPATAIETWNRVKNCISAVISAVVRERDAASLTTWHTATIKTSFEEWILRASMRNYWFNSSGWSNLLLLYSNRPAAMSLGTNDHPTATNPNHQECNLWWQRHMSLPLRLPLPLSLPLQSRKTISVDKSTWSVRYQRAVKRSI